MSTYARKYCQPMLPISILFFVLAALILHPQPLYAVDHTPDDDRDGIPNSVECIGKATTLPLAVINGSFELPEIQSTLALTSKQWGSYPKIAVAYKSFLIDGWSTTATDSEIELWRSGYENVRAHKGKQFAEINANQSAALYQDIATSPGSTMRWSFAHRGRTGTDTIELLVGAPDGPYTSLGTFATDKNRWSVYEGTYVVPEGQTITRFFYKAIATANGNTTTGNFLDDIQFFQLGSCDRDTDGDGVINSSDLDSDNDGILDIVEAGLTDSNGDGQVDQESDLGSAGGVPDYDSDDIPDFLDLDADGDGIPDGIEGPATADYTAPSGTVDSDGIDHAYGGGIAPIDTDNDGDPDYVDRDSDGDGWSDKTESHSELLKVDGDGDGLDRAIDADDTQWGPPIADITDPMAIYPNDGSENDWRNQLAENNGSGVGSGGDGGLESEPLPGNPSIFLGSVGEISQDETVVAAGLESADVIWHKANKREVYVLGLDELMPAAGPLNTTPQPAVPADVLAVTTAPDAKAVDFVDEAGNVQAVALGILSVGEPYAHDYGVCNRFKGYEFDQIAPQLIDVPPADKAWFWHSTAQSAAHGYEDALIFHIFVDETARQFHIDSTWTQDEYDAGFAFSFDYVFNMQVWSNDPTTTEQLLQAILLRLNSFGEGNWQVIYHNETAPTTPTVFIKRVGTTLDTVTLDIAALGSEPITVQIHGTWRSQTDRLTLQPFAQSVTLAAGTTNIPLTFPGLLDATIYVESNGFADKVYAGSGLWFVAGPDQSNADKLTLGNCRATDGIDKQDLFLAGCADLAAVTPQGADTIGIGRTLNPNGMPVDVSPYQALRFWAKGNGTPVRVLLETAAIKDADYYQAVFVPTNEWQQYILPLSHFRQRGFGETSVYTGRDVKAVLWLNAESNGQPLALSLDQISFTNTGLLSPTTLAESNSDTTARTVSFVATEASAIAQTVLYYSLNEGQSYQAAAMNATRATDGQTTVQGQLPGQPLGTDVRYYVEVLHVNGYRSRMPIDAPRSYYRYQIDDRPTLLVDDFGGERPLNRIGGNSGLFNELTHGGSLTAYQSAQQLVLDYQVDQSDQYAGYYTELKGLHAETYTTIDLLIRGAAGGEQFHVGLRDGNGYEPRLSVGDFLPGGVTSTWQWIQIPLASFGKQLDRTDLHSLSLTFYNTDVPTTGRLYVAEIRLTTLPTAQVIDSFDDGDLEKNGQGLGYWTSAPNGTLAAKVIDGDATHSGGHALQLDFTVGNDGYALWHSELGEMHAPADSLLTLWVRGAAPTVPVSLYLSDGTQRARVALADYVTPTMQWQLVAIPLSAFTGQGLNPNTITGFEIAFEFGTGSGTLWFDNIRLGEPTVPQVNRRVIHLHEIDALPLALHSGDGSRWTVTSDVDWLLFTVSGAGADTLVVQSAPWGLAPGAYNGTVTVRRSGPSGTAATEQIAVHLTITEAHDAPNQIFLPVVVR
ncbi:MAG: hypothetical protein KDE53_29035 [Caldilineaceae bacterium]|nr:hypothetical protein [Caldilineaceae bacterium]